MSENKLIMPYREDIYSKVAEIVEDYNKQQKLNFSPNVLSANTSQLHNVVESGMEDILLSHLVKKQFGVSLGATEAKDIDVEDIEKYLNNRTVDGHEANE